MSHPYSGAASYIYANANDYPDPRHDQSPYSHMRSVIPMHSLITLQEPWPPHEDSNRISGATDQQRASNWGSEGGIMSSEMPRRTWKSRAIVWRENFMNRVQRTLKSVRTLLTFRFPPWIVPARPSLSTVRSGSPMFSF